MISILFKDNLNFINNINLINFIKYNLILLNMSNKIKSKKKEKD